MHLVFLIVLLALILLVFFVPYGVDVSYEAGAVGLGIKAGPVRISIPLGEKGKKEKEPKKDKEPDKTAAADETIKVKPKKKPDPDFLLALAGMALRAIRRLFRSFSIDYLKLHYTVAGDDPYRTAMQYGCACQAVEALPLLAGGAVSVRRRDIVIAPDFTADKPEISVRIVISLQLYKLAHLAAAFGAEFLQWKINDRREKKAAAVSERMEDHGRQQDQ